MPRPARGRLSGPTMSLPRIVIIGGGFGGLAAAKGFRGRPVDFTVIDRTNHHLFQPLLYQVATAGLAPSDITVPIRWILRNERNVRVDARRSGRIDPAESRTRSSTASRNRSAYDALIVAAGLAPLVFRPRRLGAGRAGAQEPRGCARDPATVSHGVRTRGAVSDESGRAAALMTFVIVGGGPTGVELAGMMIEIVRKAMPTRFPKHRHATRPCDAR